MELLYALAMCSNITDTGNNTTFVQYKDSFIWPKSVMYANNSFFWFEEHVIPPLPLILIPLNIEIAF